MKSFNFKRRDHRVHGPAAGAPGTPSASTFRGTLGPEPEIPELKKQEKERKGAGVGWGAAAPGGTGLGGLGSGAAELGAGLSVGTARVGASVASRGLLARMAMAVSRFLGGPGTALGGFFAGKFGAPAVAGLMSLWGALMVGAGVQVLGGGVVTLPDGTRVSLPGLSSSVVVDKARDSSLGYLAKANEGELVWNAQNPNAPKDSVGKVDAAEPEPAAEAVPEAPPVAKAEAVAGEKPALGGNFSKGLTASLNGGGSSARLANGLSGFSLKDNFKKNGGVGGGKTPQQLQGRSNLGSMKRGMQKLQARNINTRNATANRAMGQLKFAKGMSTTASAAGDTASKTYAGDAFEQGTTQGGEMGGISAGTGVVAPLGTTADPGSMDTSVPSAPEVGETENQTPYQGLLDGAKGMGNAAAMLKLISVVLIAAGIALIAMASGPWAAFIIAIGIALIAAGAMMFMMAMNMASAAKGMGSQIEDAYGQDDQGAIVDECADQAVADGTKVDACNPSTKPEVEGRGNVHEATQEESNATFQTQ
ncbi:MAG TPA: hypothetical protein DD417_01720 [Elusimicrobia bacterium]|nr:hypothetical protein [Elusimicrobiota bacterium]